MMDYFPNSIVQLARGAEEFNCSLIQRREKVLRHVNRGMILVAGQ